MDFSLSDEQQAFVESARAFSAGVLAPKAAEWDATSHFPKEALAEAGELGFMGMYTPESAGGLGLPRLDASLIVEELSKGCTTTTAFLTIHNMATSMIGKYCSQSVIDEWCPELVMGTKLASYCLTEPGSGSDAAGLRCVPFQLCGQFIRRILRRAPGMLQDRDKLQNTRLPRWHDG